VKMKKKIRLISPDGKPIFHRIIYGKGRFDETHTDPKTGIAEIPIYELKEGNDIILTIGGVHLSYPLEEFLKEEEILVIIYPRKGIVYNFNK
jgi:hypothetical protein